MHSNMRMTTGVSVGIYGGGKERPHKQSEELLDLAVFASICHAIVFTVYSI